MKQAAIELFTIFLIALGRYLAIAGSAFVVVYKWLPARMAAAKIQLRTVAASQVWQEIRHSATATLMLVIVAYAVMAGPLRPYTLIYANVYDYPLWWLPLSFVLALVMHDTYFYWLHRLIHHKRIFRHVHLVHHLSVNPTPWSSYSFHAVEAVLEAGIIPVLAFTLPLYPATIAAFTLASFIINVYGHLGYEIMPRWFRRSVLFGIINTSCHHNQHHRRFRGNYGLYFRFWDRLMKTEHPDYVAEYDKVQERRFGK